MTCANCGGRTDPDTTWTYIVRNNALITVCGWQCVADYAAFATLMEATT